MVEAGFTSAEANEVVSAAINAGFGDERRLLLHGLSPKVRASLPNQVTPGDQLRSDFITLAGLGVRRVSVWLRNAVTLAEGLPSIQAVFRKYLDRCDALLSEDSGADTPTPRTNMVESSQAAEVPNRLTIAIGSNPDRASLAFCPTDVAGTPGSLNQQVIQQRGLEFAQLRSASPQLAEKGFARLGGTRPAIAVVTVARHRKLSPLQAHLTAALLSVSETPKQTLWIPAMGTRHGALTPPQSVRLSIIALRDAQTLRHHDVELSVARSALIPDVIEAIEQLARTSGAMLQLPPQSSGQETLSERFLHLLRQRGTMTSTEVHEALNLKKGGLGGIYGSLIKKHAADGTPLPFRKTSIAGQEAWRWGADDSNASQLPEASDDDVGEPVDPPPAEGLDFEYEFAEAEGPAAIAEAPSSSTKRAQPPVAVKKAAPSPISKPSPPKTVPQPKPASTDLLIHVRGATRRLIWRGEVVFEVTEPPIDWEASTFGPDEDLPLAGVRKHLAGIWDRADLLVFGTQLRQALFPGLALKANHAIETATRVVLDLDANAARGPWEYLVFGKKFLLERRLSIVRHVPATSAKSLRAQDWLPVALVSASPVNDKMSWFEEGDHRAQIAAALPAGRVQDIGQCTRARLTELATTNTAKALHFLGHGEARKGIALLNLSVEAGYESIDPYDFANLVKLADGLNLVFLGACHGGAIAPSGDLGLTSVALRIAQTTGVPVVAMQVAVPQDFGTAFAAEFYRQLAAADGDIERAVYQTRHATPGGRAVFGIPVVYADAYAQPERAELPELPEFTLPATVTLKVEPNDDLQAHIAAVMQAAVATLPARIVQALDGHAIPKPDSPRGVVDALRAANAPEALIEEFQRAQSRSPAVVADRVWPETPELQIDTETVDRVVRDIRARYAFSEALVVRILGELAAGRHVMLTGPVGTGKTTLAREITRGLGRMPKLYTAHAEWTAFDVVGGFWPQVYEDAQGAASERLVFREGCFVEAMMANWVEREDGVWSTNPVGSWLIIDELNRADMDRAMGELFTALSAQTIRVPCVSTGASTATTELSIPKDFRVLATMNTVDRHYLFRLSDALKRRFAFVEVPVADNVDEWTKVGPAEPDLRSRHVRDFVYRARAAGHKVGTALLIAALDFLAKTRTWGALDDVAATEQAIIGSIVPTLEDAAPEVILALLAWAGPAPALDDGAEPPAPGAHATLIMPRLIQALEDIHAQSTP